MNILKQSAASVTVLKRKLREDLISSTRIKIIACLTFFVGIIAISFIVLIEYVKNIFMVGMVESLTFAVSTGTTDPAILADSNATASNATYGAIFIFILLAALCTIAVSRLALAPIREAFRIQKRFISGIAHELRTPLSIIRINNEIARFDVDSSSAVAKIFDNTIADIDRISEMLSNLLLFDRMASVESLRFREVNLTQIIDNVVARLSELALQRGVSVSVTGAPFESPLGNEAALEQILYNIVKNALTYTAKGGAVTISHAGTTERTILIKITDTGLGIPEKDLPHIFEPFYRTEKAGKLSGIGIGLAIVSEIMKLHKGTIEVESVEGKGTSFLICLPLFKTEKGSGVSTSSSKVFFNFLDKR